MKMQVTLPPTRTRPTAVFLPSNDDSPPITVEPAKQPPLPSTFEMAKNLTKSALTVAKGILQGQPLKETDAEAQRRLEICRRCEFFRKADQRCARCGCYMAVKTYLKSMKCPLAVPRW